MQLADTDAPPRSIWRDADEEDDLDPFIAFGQLVKGASKGLWRRVSLKDPKVADEAQTAREEAVVEKILKEQEQNEQQPKQGEDMIEPEVGIILAEVVTTNTIREELEQQPQPPTIDMS